MASKYQLKRQYRNPKFLTSRNIGEDASIGLLVHPLYPGETLKNVRLHVQSTATVNVDEFIEINYRGMILPAGDLGFVTNSSFITDQVAQDTSKIDEVAHYHNVAKSGASSDDFYGGDSGEETTEDDKVMGAMDYAYYRKSVAEQWFKREKLMRNNGALADDKHFLIDEFDTVCKKDRYIREPSVLMLTAYRFEVKNGGSQENWAMEKLDDIFAGTNRNYASLMWNPEFIQEQLETGIGADETSARELLLGMLQGDNYITSKSSAATVYVKVKASVSIHTPINSPHLG